MKPEFSAFIAFPAQSCTLVLHHRPHRKICRFGDGWFGRIRWTFPNRGRQDCLQKQECRTHLDCCVDSTHKPGRLPQEPHPPRRAHDTLQPQDESIIVGYYTSAGSATRPAGPYKRERSSMARNDGIDRTSARNVNLTAAKIGNAQRHNEREKESYTNPDIIPERTPQNIHFKQPTAGYAEMFAQMEQDGIISTRGLKSDANLYGELIFDVNSAYFYNHGGYEFAKRFYEDAYRAAIEIVGGEQYILSAVMHADERNRAMSEALGQDVFHYHLHVVYVPVVEKQILWSKRCKDKSLVGTVKETIMQVSSSKKWLSKPALDEQGAPILQKNGKPVLRKSYSVLQDDFFQAMRNAGYSDVERGERGSSEEHLTVTQFKVEREQERLEQLTAQTQQKEQQAASLEKKIEKIQKQQIAVQEVEQIEPHPVPFSSKVMLDRSEYENLAAAAKKFYVQERKESKIQKTLDAAMKMISELKAKVAALTAELAEYKSIRGQLRTTELERQNSELRSKLHSYEDTISRNRLWSYFSKQKEKSLPRNNVR